MEMSKKQLFFLLLVQSTLYCPKTPVAIYFDLVYQNEEADNLVKNLIYAPALFSVLRNKFGYIKATYVMTQLLYHKTTMKDMGEELGKTITGIGNVTKALMTEVRNKLNIDLPDEALRPLIELAISPIQFPENIKLIRQIKSHKHTIGLSAQDPLSFEIYRQKMNTKYNVEISELFDSIVINPALYENKINLNPKDRKTSTNIIISENISPADSLSLAVQAATQHVAKQKNETPIIKTYEELRDYASKQLSNFAPF